MCIRKRDEKRKKNEKKTKEKKRVMSVFNFGGGQVMENRERGGGLM